MTITVTQPVTGEVVQPRQSRGQGGSPYLLVPITLLFALLIVAVIRAPHLVTSAGLGSAVIVAAPLILATYALMSVAIAGRGTVELSIGPLISFINVTLIQLVDSGLFNNPITTFAYAILLGILYELILGSIIVFVRVQPIIVSLSGYLALNGINMVILPRPGGVAPDWMADWGAGISVLSPVLVVVVLATVAWFLFARTAFFTHLRLMGSDERAAYTSGIPITIVRLGAHAIAGAYAGLAAITFTSLIGSGDPSQGRTYTLIAVTAMVLGGTSLAGGRGGVMGSLFGAVNLYLITYVLATLNFGAVQSFVTDLSYGTILVISLLLTLALPFIQRHVRSFSPLLYFVALSMVTLGVILHSTFDYASLAGAAKDGAAIAPTVAAPFHGVLEGVYETAGAPGQGFSSTWVMAGVLLVLIPILLRVVVSRSSREDVSLAIYLVIGALVLLVGYTLAFGSGHDFPLLLPGGAR